MKSKLLLFYFFSVLITQVGCQHEQGASGIAVDHSRRAGVYTEADLNKLITPGMSTGEVTNKFGLPGSVVEMSEGLFHLTYMFPFEVKQQKEPYVTGFSVDIKKSQVVRWAVTTGMTVDELQGDTVQSGVGGHRFQMFLITDSLTDLVNTVDAKGSADTSGLKATPDLTLEAQVFTGKDGSDGPDEQTVRLVIDEQDVSKLKDLTGNNLGRRILIVSGNEAIAAPLISVPLVSRQFIFKVKSSSVLTNIQSN